MSSSAEMSILNSSGNYCSDMAADGQRAIEVIQGIRALVRKEKSARGLLDLNAVISGHGALGGH